MWVRDHIRHLLRLGCMVQVYLLSWITSPLLFLAHNPAGCRRSLYVVHRSSWWSGRVSFSAMGGVEPEGPTRVPDPIPDHESMTHTNAHRRCQVHAVQNSGGARNHGRRGQKGLLPLLPPLAPPLLLHPSQICRRDLGGGFMETTTVGGAWAPPAPPLPPPLHRQLLLFCLCSLHTPRFTLGVAEASFRHSPLYAETWVTRSDAAFISLLWIANRHMWYHTIGIYYYIITLYMVSEYIVNHT